LVQSEIRNGSIVCTISVILLPAVTIGENVYLGGSGDRGGRISYRACTGFVLWTLPVSLACFALWIQIRTINAIDDKINIVMSMVIPIFMIVGMSINISKRIYDK